jgi:hypothetical protein
LIVKNSRLLQKKMHCEILYIASISFPHVYPQQIGGMLSVLSPRGESTSAPLATADPPQASPASQPAAPSAPAPAPLAPAPLAPRWSVEAVRAFARRLVVLRAARSFDAWRAQAAAVSSRRAQTLRRAADWMGLRLAARALATLRAWRDAALTSRHRAQRADAFARVWAQRRRFRAWARAAAHARRARAQARQEQQLQQQELRRKHAHAQGAVAVRAARLRLARGAMRAWVALARAARDRRQLLTEREQRRLLLGRLLHPEASQAVAATAVLETAETTQAAAGSASMPPSPSRGPLVEATPKPTAKKVEMEASRERRLHQSVS